MSGCCEERDERESLYIKSVPGILLGLEQRLPTSDLLHWENNKSRSIRLLLELRDMEDSHTPPWENIILSQKRPAPIYAGYLSVSVVTAARARHEREAAKDKT